MTTARIRFFLMAALAVAPLASSAVAAPFMDITFDGDTLGSPPTTAPFGGFPITNLNAIGGYTVSSPPEGDSPPTAASGTIVVGNVTGISKGAVMTTNPANQEIGALWLDTGFSLATQQYKMSFDLNIVNAPATATQHLKKLNNTNTDVGILLGINTFSTAPSNIGPAFAVIPTSAGGGSFSFRDPTNTIVNTFFNYSNGDKHHLEFDVNYTTGLLDAYVDGNLELSNYAFIASGASNVTVQEFFTFLNGESGFANQVAIDNLNVEATPEPSTFVLAGIGLVGLLAVRRKRRSA